MSFENLYRHGFIRVAAASINVELGSPVANAGLVLAALEAAAAEGATLVVFPEMTLTGATVGDLAAQDSLLESVEDALLDIALTSANYPNLTAVVGAPVRVAGEVYNAAVVIRGGAIFGITPKAYLGGAARGSGTDQARCFEPGVNLSAQEIPGEFAGQTEVPFGADLIYYLDGEPEYAFYPLIGSSPILGPDRLAALAGAKIICQMLSTPRLAGGEAALADAARVASADTVSAWILAAGARGESSTDAVYAPFTAVYENGSELRSQALFDPAVDATRAGEWGQLTLADVDVAGLDAARRSRNFTETRAFLAPTELADFTPVEVAFALADACECGGECDCVGDGCGCDGDGCGCDDEKCDCGGGDEKCDCDGDGCGCGGDCGCDGDDVPDALTADLAYRPLRRQPFVPKDPAALREIPRLQARALAQRLQAIGNPNLIIGVSGGLDSTLALLVLVETCEFTGQGKEKILAYTMPGFGTSENTKNNAHRLAAALGVELHTLDIRDAATQMLKDIGHPTSRGEEVYDVTYENVQAGLRTDYLFRLANQNRGIVIGTGDLSEIALGWCTYGVGDHMAHYGLNAGLPKTVIQALIRAAAQEAWFGPETAQVLEDILSTDVSPELIPTRAGHAPQTTEGSIGRYLLHDFFLYQTLTTALGPARLAYLASRTFPDTPRAEIISTLETFIKRFFSQQFKRSVSVNAPQVLPYGTLSPRGGWAMPADASPAAWLQELEQVRGAWLNLL